MSTRSGGDLLPMADQFRRAVAWVYKNAKSFGGDPKRIYVSGHSSGGHLAGVRARPPTGRRTTAAGRHGQGRAALLSGMYDLKPVRLSARSSYVKFTDETEEELSSQRHLDKLIAPVAIVYGTLETPEFQRQTPRFCARP